MTCWRVGRNRRDLKSGLITSQMPVDYWHELSGDPVLADAILDRLIHNAHSVPLKGESLRKNKQNWRSPKLQTDPSLRSDEEWPNAPECAVLTLNQP